MATSMTRQEVAKQLEQSNGMLEQAHDKLADERYDSDVAALSQQLRKYGRQVRRAIVLYNERNTTGAEATMPTHQAVMNICQQADALRAFGHGDTPNPDDADESAEEDSNDTDDSTEESTPTPPPPSTTPDAPKQSPAPLNELEQALLERSSDKDNPLNYDDLAAAAAGARWVRDRTAPIKRRGTRRNH